MRQLGRLFDEVEAVIISDYAYGIITPGLRSQLQDLQHRSPRVLLVDARDLTTYRGLRPTAVKPNFEEASELLALPRLAAYSRAEALRLHGARILELTGAQIAAVTLDRDGALVFEAGGQVHTTTARATRNARVAGAGDTFSAAFALGLAADAGAAAAAGLATAAATLVVGKEGTVACTASELREFLTSDGKYIGDRAALVSRIEAYRRQGRRVVFTNGCFDILHSGHITYLNRARGVDDVLVVGLNADASVRRLKGPERPINPLEDRARVLAALTCVDHVVPFEEDTPVEIIRVLRPDLYVKGGDYTEETLPEAPLVRSLGGEVQILPFVDDRSTTGIIDRIRKSPPSSRRRVARDRSSRGERRPVE